MTTLPTDLPADRLTYLREPTMACAKPRTMFANSLHANNPIFTSTLPFTASSHCSSVSEAPLPLVLLSRHGSKSAGTEPSQEIEEDDDWHLNLVCNIKNSRGKKLSTGFSVTFTIEGPNTLMIVIEKI